MRFLPDPFGRQHVRLLLPLIPVLLALLTLTPATAQRPTSVAITVEPATVDLTVALGQAATLFLLVRNTGDEALALSAYEALPPTQMRTRAMLPAMRIPLPNQREKLDTTLQAAFRAAPDRPREFLVYLAAQADLAPAFQIADWRQRGQFVYDTLTTQAAKEQADLVVQLGKRGLAYRSLWVINALLVRGTLADAQALTARPDVALVRANHTRALPRLEANATSGSQCSPDAPTNPVCWNVRAIGADRVWGDYGVDGRGVVVASVDTGVAVEHTALSENYRGYSASNGYANDYNWYDPQGRANKPTDEQGHGTHTMGTMIGQAEGEGVAVGVAPGAHWIAAQGCESTYCSDADLFLSAQWMLAPTRLDGSDPRPDLRPHIINNSWAYGSDNSWYAPYTAAWRAAGIFPVFAAGNAESGAAQCQSVASPGDYADVLAVGATNRDGILASFSLLGPARDGRVKPDLTAPGVAIYSTVPPERGDYATLNGTSMAAPHVAGTVALLWQANPALIGDYEATAAILRDTATRVQDDRCGGTPGGANNAYGYGRLDAYAAVTKARVDLPWLAVDLVATPLQPNGASAVVVNVDAANIPGPGVYTARVLLFGNDLTRPLASVPITMRVPDDNKVAVTGRVRQQGSNQPIQAQVAVARNGQRGLPISTALDGRFALAVAPGVAYQLTVSAPGFRTFQQVLQVSTPTQLDLELAIDQPVLGLPTVPISTTLPFGGEARVRVPIENRGTRPLHYQVNVPPDRYQMARSDEDGGPTYNWIELPEDAPQLPAVADGLTDHVPLGFTFPFFTFTVTDVVLTGNGIIAFDRPFTYSGVSTNCLPDEWVPFYLIAPLRLDLDLSAGGRARYGTVDDHFVLSYEDVPLQGGEPGKTFTFQAVLYRDGRIRFQYKQLAALPARVSAGIQRTPFDLLQIGCGPTTPVYNGLAIELRPQADSSTWLAADTTVGVVAPGERSTIPVIVHWSRPSPTLRYAEGRLLLTTNDTSKPAASIPIRLYAQAAPYERWLLFASKR